MDDRVLRIDRVHDGETRVQHPLLLGPREGDAEILEAYEGVEVAAVGDVVAHLSVPRHVDGLVQGVAVRGDVLQGHRFGVPVAHLDAGRDEPGGCVEPDQGLRFGDLDHAGLDEDRRDADGSVPAHRQAAGDLDEEDPEVGIRPGRGLQDRPGHRGVPARLAHQQGAQVVAFGEEALPTLEHRRPGQDAHAPVITRVGIPSVCESTAW